jgi:hypothetical protein
VHGHGLRWNIAERAQAFTTLWTLVIAAAYAIRRSLYIAHALDGPDAHGDRDSVLEALMNYAAR